MLKNIKIIKTQLSKIIQSEEFEALSGKFAGPMMKVAVPLAKNGLASLPTMISASEIDGTIQRKMFGKGAIATRGVGVVKVGKGITLFISNENMNDVIRSIKSLLNSGVFVDGVCETVKHERKNKRVDFLVC